jgi:bacterioferritin-associated ferredoxin
VNIDRCICTGMTFTQVLEQARANDWDLDAIRRETAVGGNCGLCRPYVRRALTTGETVFHQVITEGPDAP